MNALILLLLITTSQVKSILAIDDIPSSYISTKPLKSLFCNTCAVLSSFVNETLYDSSKDFESLVGFRLDSTGKKVRKQSGWLKLFLSLEDVCDDWEDKYRVAKRKNEYLYLIEEKVIAAMGDSEWVRKQKVEKEARDRLKAQWDMEWEIEWNKTHDEMGNLIDEKSESESEKDQEYILAQHLSHITRYYHEKKPKLIKKKAKQHKIIKEMCYFLSEQLDDWLHEKSKTVSNVMKEGDDLKDHLELMFCLEGKVCNAKMFDITPKIYKFKKVLYIPKKHDWWVPPNQRDIGTQIPTQNEGDENEKDDNNDNDNDEKAKIEL